MQILGDSVELQKHISAEESWSKHHKFYNTGEIYIKVYCSRIEVEVDHRGFHSNKI